MSLSGCSPWRSGSHRTPWPQESLVAQLPFYDKGTLFGGWLLSQGTQNRPKKGAQDTTGLPLALNPQPQTLKP